MALVFAGCDGNLSTGPLVAPTALANVTASEPADLSGVWQFHEDATFVLYDFSGDHSGSKVFRCSTDGTYTFVQTDATFTGTFDQVGTCTAADGTSFPNTFSGPVEGAINGTHVKFQPPPGECFDEGTLLGPNEMVGSGKCGGGGIFGTYRASWSATR
jgi:hypothetical protein